MYHGFVGLPEKIVVKKPVTDFSDVSDQNEIRQVFLKTSAKFFTDADYIKKLLEFWTLEEKGKLKANKRSNIVKLITRNNGPDAIKLVMQYAHEFGVDKDQWKQRCAADILCGILYGMKLWDEKMVEEVWTDMKPIFNDCLNSVTQETIAFWSNAMCSPTVCPFLFMSLLFSSLQRS